MSLVSTTFEHDVPCSIINVLALAGNKSNPACVDGANRAMQDQRRISESIVLLSLPSQRICSPVFGKFWIRTSLESRLTSVNTLHGWNKLDVLAVPTSG